MTSEKSDRGDDAPSALEKHHRQHLWIPWTLVILGLWLLAAPLTTGYLNDSLWQVPSGGRGAWFADEVRHLSLRAHLMVVSDMVSGALLVVLGWRTLTPNRPVSQWGACLVGVWLLFAPVVLWSPAAIAYVNDSLVGMLVIALTILIPGMPNMVRFMQPGPSTPPGWTYNPSTWSQRSILILLGFAGMIVSRYLGAFQLGYVDSVWDPFFGFAGGTEPVLNSEMSHMWPVSDGALGGVAYSLEFLMGFMGAKSRWRTMPWMVSMFGVLVVPLGLSHIALVMSQPVVVHHWSTFALLAAAIMLPMITLTVDEVVAMAQHVRDGVRRGDREGSAWRVFWLGGAPGESSPDESTDAIVSTFPQRPGQTLGQAVRGATAPPGLLVMTALGAWLLFAPAALGVSIRSGAADVAHIGGAAVIVIAVAAMAEPVRRLRLLGTLVGLGIVGCALLGDAGTGYTATLIASGAAVAVTSIPRGRVRHCYGDWRWLTR